MLEIYFSKKSDEHYWTLHDVIEELVYTVQKRVPQCKVLSEVGLTKVDRFECTIQDCEIVIYDTLTDKLKAISYSESKDELWDVFKKRNRSEDLLIILHRESWGLREIDLSQYKFKVETTTFFPYSPKTNYEFYYRRRKLIPFNQLKDQLFFLCSGRGDQKTLSDRGITNPPSPGLSIDQYLSYGIQFKAGLAIAGGAELCHRDIEYMAIGLPLLRLEYVNLYDPPLIPDFHYISIPRGDIIPKDSNLDNKGGELYIRAYKQRFEQVKDDKEFLDFVSLNAFEYYYKNVSPCSRITMLLNKLEI